MSSTHESVEVEEDRGKARTKDYTELAMAAWQKPDEEGRDEDESEEMEGAKDAGSEMSDLEVDGEWGEQEGTEGEPQWPEWWGKSVLKEAENPDDVRDLEWLEEQAAGRQLWAIHEDMNADVDELFDKAVSKHEGTGEEDAYEAERLYKHVLLIQPSHIGALCNFGSLVSELRKDCVTAERAYVRALRLEPNDVPTLSNYADMIQAKTMAYDKARELYDRAIMLEPNHVPTLYNYACMLEEGTGDLGGALQLLARARDADPASADVLSAIERISDCVGAPPTQHDSARLYKEALSLAPADSRLMSGYARVLHKKRGDATRAIALLRLALQADEANVQALVLLGNLLALKGETGKAAVLLKRAEEIDPQDADMLMSYAAFAWAEWGDEMLSLSLLERLLKQDALHTEACRLYAQILGEGCKGPPGFLNTYQARVFFEKALRSHPADAAIMCGFARLEELQQDRLAARRRYAEALEMSPQYAHALAGLASVLVDRPKVRCFESFRNEVARQAGVETWEEGEDEAGVGASGGTGGDAVRLLRQALQRDATCTRALVLLGDTLAGEAGREADAEKLYRRALEVSPVDLKAAAGLGGVLKRLEARREAELVYQRALEIAPEDAGCLRGYGDLLCDGELEDARGARVLMERAVRNDPMHAATQTKLANHMRYKLGNQTWPGKIERYYYTAVLATEETDSGKLMDLGDYIMDWSKGKDFERAGEVYFRGWEVDPSNVALLYRVAELSHKNGDSEFAAECLTNRSLLFPNDPAAAHLRANVEERLLMSQGGEQRELPLVRGPHDQEEDEEEEWEEGAIRLDTSTRDTGWASQGSAALDTQSWEMRRKDGEGSSVSLRAAGWEKKDSGDEDQGGLGSEAARLLERLHLSGEGDGKEKGSSSSSSHENYTTYAWEPYSAAELSSVFDQPEELKACLAAGPADVVQGIERVWGMYQRAAALSPAAPAVYTDFAGFVEHAFGKTGRYAALHAYCAALSLRPDDPHTLSNAAAFYFVSTGDFDTTEAMLALGLRVGKGKHLDTPYMLARLATMYLMKEDPPAHEDVEYAEALLTRAHELLPEDEMINATMRQVWETPGSCKWKMDQAMCSRAERTFVDGDDFASNSEISGEEEEEEEDRNEEEEEREEERIRPDDIVLGEMEGGCTVVIRQNETEGRKPRPRPNKPLTRLEREGKQAVSTVLKQVKEHDEALRKAGVVDSEEVEMERETDVQIEREAAEKARARCKPPFWQRYDAEWLYEDKKRSDIKVMEEVDEYNCDYIHIPDVEEPPDNYTVMFRRFKGLGQTSDKYLDSCTRTFVKYRDIERLRLLGVPVKIVDHEEEKEKRRLEKAANITRYIDTAQGFRLTEDQFRFKQVWNLSAEQEAWWNSIPCLENIATDLKMRGNYTTAALVEGLAAAWGELPDPPNHPDNYTLSELLQKNCTPVNEPGWTELKGRDWMRSLDLPPESMARQCLDALDEWVRDYDKYGKMWEDELTPVYEQYGFEKGSIFSSYLDDPPDQQMMYEEFEDDGAEEKAKRRRLRKGRSLEGEAAAEEVSTGLMEDDKEGVEDVGSLLGASTTDRREDNEDAAHSYSAQDSGSGEGELAGSESRGEGEAFFPEGDAEEGEGSD